jgi:hypothetical protein
VIRFAYLALRWTSSVSRWTRRRFTVPGRVVLGAALAGAVLGVETERSMTYQAFALLIAVLACAMPFAWRFRPRVVLERELPRLATAGVPFSYRVTLRAEAVQRGIALLDNIADPRPDYAQFRAAARADWRFFWRPTLFDIWRRLVRINGGITLHEQPLADVPARRALEVRPSVTPRRRGMLRFAALTLARPDPFNLVKACADFHAVATVLVLPKTYRLPPLMMRGARRYQPGGVAQAASVGDAEEFVSLRDYRPGDPLQRVHWKSYARVGHPVVKEYQDEFFERHALALDTFARGVDEETFEEAVAVAASFAATVETRECLLDLIFVGDETYSYTAGRGQLQAQHLVEVLAAVVPKLSGDFSLLAESMLANRAELSSAILVLLAWDDARRELVAKLRAGGLQVLVLVVSKTPEKITGRAPWLVVLQPGKIESGLALLEGA